MVMLSDPGKVMIAVAGFSAVWGSIHVIASSIVRYAEIRSGRHKPELGDTQTQARLERIEQAMDAIAIEVERISENQRFTTRLLAERSDSPALPERAISSK